MFELKYNISTGKHSNLVDADEAFLRYNFLQGNVLMHTNIVTISIWDIPLLDFAVSMKIIAHSLNEKKEHIETFEFTDSADEIRFKKVDNDLTISTTFSKEIINVRYEEFDSAVEYTYEDLVNDIAAKYPELTTNKNYQQILALS